MTTKKKNKLLLKIGIACTAFLAFLTCLVTPTFAYTLSNDYVYSDNGLNLNNYSNLTFTNNNYNTTESMAEGSLVITPSLPNNLDDSDRTRFKFQFFNGGVFVREIVTYTREQVNVNNEAYFQCYDLFTGYTLSELISAYSDYRVRFIRDEVSPSNVGNDYIEYRLGEIFNYYAMFIPTNTTIRHFGICFSVSTININVNGSIFLNEVGAYCGYQVGNGDFVPYGIYGNTTTNAISVNSYNDGLRDGRIESQATIENLNDELDAKQVVIDHLNNENNILTQQLNNVNGSWQSVFFSMVDIPFLTASKALGFELFGLNLYRAFIGILTVLAIFFVFRKISGK